MANDIIFSIGANTKQAAESLGKLEGSFNLLKAAAGAAIGVLAGKAIANGISTVIEASNKQQDAINKLNVALKTAGDFSADASTDLQKFASNLQSVTTVGDETTLELLSLAKAFGVSNEQAKDLVSAAVDLSAATGLTLDGAVKNLGKTFSGLTGELGESVPALKNFSKEQLQAGAAIDLIIDRFGGSAQQQAQTYSASIIQLSNAYGDLQESLGDVITQNPVLVGAIKVIKETFEQLTQTIKNNQKDASAFVSSVVIGVAEAAPLFVAGISAMVTAVDEVVNRFRLARAGIKELAAGLADFFGDDEGASKLRKEQEEIFQAVVDSEAAFDKIQSTLDTLGVAAADAAIKIGNLSDTTKKASDTANASGEAFDNSAKKIAKPAVDATAEYKNLIKELTNVTNANEKIGKSAKELINIDLEQRKEYLKTIREKLKGEDKYTDKIKGVIDKIEEQAEVTADLNKAELKRSKDAEAAQKKEEKAKTIREGFISQLKTINDELARRGKGVEELINLEYQQAIAAIDQQTLQLKLAGQYNSETESIIESLKLAQKAKKDFALEDLGDQNFKANLEIAADVAQGIIDGFEGVLTGGYLAEIFKFIEDVAKTPEKLFELIENFSVVLENLVENLPDIINKIIDQIPKLTQKINKLFVELIDIITEEFPKLAKTFADSMLDFSQTLFQQLPRIFDALPDILRPFTENLSEVLNSLFKNLGPIFRELISAIGEIIADLIREFDEIIIDLFDNLPDILDGLIDGIFEAADKIAEAMIDELVRELDSGRVLSAVVRGTLKAIFKVYDRLVFSGYKALFAGIAQAFERVDWQGVADNLGEAFGNQWEAFGQKIFYGLWNPLQSAQWDEYGRKIATGLQQWFSEAGTYFSNLGSYIGSGFSSGFGNFSGFFLGLGGNILQGFTNGFGELQSLFSGGGLSFTNSVSKFNWQSLGERIVEGFKKAFGSLKDFGKGIYEGIREGIKDLGPIIADSIKQALSGDVGGSIPGSGGAGSLGEKALDPLGIAGRSNVASIGGNPFRSSAFEGGSQSSGGPVNIVLQVGEAELAQVMLNLNQQGFKTA